MDELFSIKRVECSIENKGVANFEGNVSLGLAANHEAGRRRFMKRAGMTTLGAALGAVLVARSQAVAGSGLGWWYPTSKSEDQELETTAAGFAAYVLNNIPAAPAGRTYESAASLTQRIQNWVDGNTIGHTFHQHATWDEYYCIPYANPQKYRKVNWYYGGNKEHNIPWGPEEFGYIFHTVENTAGDHLSFADDYITPDMIEDLIDDSSGAGYTVDVPGTDYEVEMSGPPFYHPQSLVHTDETVEAPTFNLTHKPLNYQFACQCPVRATHADSNAPVEVIDHVMNIVVSAWRFTAPE